VSKLQLKSILQNAPPGADPKKALQVLKRAGKGNPPLRGDELPVKRARRRR
jgi:hypothetical protein